MLSGEATADPQGIMDLLALFDVPKSILSLVGNLILKKRRGPKKNSPENLEKRALAATYFISTGELPKCDGDGRFSKTGTKAITECARHISSQIGDTDTRHSLPEDRRRKSIEKYLKDGDFRFVVENLIPEFQESNPPNFDEIKEQAKLALETVSVIRLRQQSRGES